MAVEFDGSKISENEMIEAINCIYTLEEKDFDKIKSEKWYQTFFHAITLNQDGKKYAVRGIHSLAKLQQLFMNIYVSNYRKSHEQLDAAIDAVSQNSQAIKKLYHTCILRLEEQESLQTLHPFDAEILALFLGEYRDENGDIPKKVRDYNRGVLLALGQGIPSGALEHQIQKLKAPKVVYRCFLEQCAVDGTLESQNWSDNIYEILKDFELSDNSKAKIRDSVLYEMEIAGAEFFISKYAKENAGVLDTDFVYDLDGCDQNKSAEDASPAMGEWDLLSYSCSATQLVIEFTLINLRIAMKHMPCKRFSNLTVLSENELIENALYQRVPLESLKESVNKSLAMDGGFGKGLVLCPNVDSTESQKHFCLILTTEAFFFFVDSGIAVVPLKALCSINETKDGLTIDARSVQWFDHDGHASEGGKQIFIRRDRENNLYLRPLRRGLEQFVEKAEGSLPDKSFEIEEIVSNYLKKISKSSATYLVRDFELDDDKKRKKMKRALSSYARKVREADVIGFIDTSLFDNGADGLLFAKDGIAFDYAFEKVFLRYDEIICTSFNEKGTNLNFHGNFVERRNDSSVPSISNISYNLRELDACIQEIQYVS